jgi:hypothetical protein
MFPEDHLPEPVSISIRRKMVRCSILAVLGALMLASTIGLATANTAAAGAPDPVQQNRFMWAMAGQESGWDYNARNTSSGAFGKYQIMPFNWPAWAGIYLGDPQADQTPYNQERVARGKIRDLYRWLGSWKRVAYWWLTGRTDRNEKRWSAYATRYVKNIMRQRDKAPRNTGRMPPRTSSKPSSGDWRRSAIAQRLRLKPGGRAWPDHARIRDGQVIKVRRATRTPAGVRWVQILTADGRLGWLKQRHTVPTDKPGAAARWKDVKVRGADSGRSDRRLVRPRPR